MTRHTDVLNFIVTIIFTFTCKNSLARLWWRPRLHLFNRKRVEITLQKERGKSASARSMLTLWKLSLQALRFSSVAPSQYWKISNNYLLWKLHHCQRGETITCKSTIFQQQCLNSLPEKTFLWYSTTALWWHALQVPWYFYHMNLQRLPPLTCSSFLQEEKDTAYHIIKYPCQLFITALGIQQQDDGFRRALAQVHFSFHLPLL